MKLVPAVRAVILGLPVVKRDCVEQVTPSLLPSDESKVTMIWLFAVTSVLFTTVEVVVAAIETLPVAEQ